ncbi:hypothetical protein E2C01_052153 [Portunus trituberculatus]|uniref:Uncharacterized protein n=1 Tax=Portunus trituberculatus TaxID=210409 RepID=A0A5B7GKU6_PORTR|nr:hypothetical protein [Portunus trituberculatus]
MRDTYSSMSTQKPLNRSFPVRFFSFLSITKGVSYRLAKATVRGKQGAVVVVKDGRKTEDR